MSGGDHRWFKRSNREKRPVTRDIHIYNNNNNNNNNVTRMLEKKNLCGVMVGIPVEKSTLRRSVIGGCIILKLMLTE